MATGPSTRQAEAEKQGESSSRTEISAQEAKANPVKKAETKQIKFQSYHVNVSAGQVFKLPIPIEVSGSIVRYTFYEDNGQDIAFLAYLQTGTRLTAMTVDILGLPSLSVIVAETSGHIEMVPYGRAVGEIGDPVRGEVCVDETGLLFLQWDNTYSWIYPKTVSYVVELSHPQGGSDISEGLREER